MWGCEEWVPTEDVSDEWSQSLESMDDPKWYVKYGASGRSLQGPASDSEGEAAVECVVGPQATVSWETEFTLVEGTEGLLAPSKPEDWPSTSASTWGRTGWVARLFGGRRKSV